MPVEVIDIPSEVSFNLFMVLSEGLLNGITFLTKVLEEEGVKIEAEASEAVERPRSIGDMQQAFAKLSKEQLVRRVGRRS